tara:strand:- start:1339 stop:2166 length:828 start_codon:yes stop_codon:yes gene_type:complete
MAVFGTTDAAAFSNTVAVTQNDATVTKNAADTVVGGDVLEISGVNYIVKTVTSTTSIELHKVYAGSTNNSLAGANVIKRTPPKAVAEFVILGGDSNSYDLVFADATEGSLAENKSRGINGPGWWQYRSFTDHAGNTRHKAECIAAVTVASSVSGDLADDTIAADVASAVTITGQPGNSSSSSGAGTFAVTTSTTGTPGALAYVWQRQKAGTKRWVNITANLDTGITYADFATATLAYSGLGGDTLDGQNYRVKITSANGTEEVISNGAGTLTYSS